MQSFFEQPLRRPKPARPSHEPGRLVRLAGEPLLLAAALLLYLGVRLLSQGSRSEALRNARRVGELEETLELRVEHAVQGLVVPHDALVTLVNWIYVWGHWPVLAASALWLGRRRPAAYRLARNAVFVSGAIGLAVFALFPVAPPRFSDPELVDTVVRYTQGYKALQPPSLLNQFAAIPSFHFGWNLLVATILICQVRSLTARVLFAAMPLAMAFSVVATANHFLVDVLAGGAVSLLGLLVARGLARRGLLAATPAERGPGTAAKTA